MSSTRPHRAANPKTVANQHAAILKAIEDGVARPKRRVGPG